MSELFKTGEETVRMIDFVKYLYKKHKVLNKLSEKETRDFQAEVVSLLVDADQNVDRETFLEISRNIGFETFILETLGNVINRNPFKNHYELNRNLDTIAENIKKDQEELQKRQKLLERREQKVKAAEEQLLGTCKQKIAAMEGEALKKIAAKEAQVKKSISLLLNQLKNKEKLIFEKHESLKANRQILSQIDQKERAVNERLRQLERKERQLKGKDIQQTIFKKDNRLNELQEQNNRLRQTIAELNSKLKNFELAYRKMKGDNLRLANEKKEKAVPVETKERGQEKLANKRSKDCFKIQLEDLQLSVIEAKPVGSSGNKASINQPTRPAGGRQQSLNTLATQKNPTNDQLQKPTSTEFQDSALEFLRSQESDTDPHQQLIKQVQAIDLNSVAAKEKLISSGLLQLLFQRVDSLRYPLQVCIELLEMMLPLMEMDAAHTAVSAYLQRQALVDAIQKVYLCHETSTDIAESATLILSRVKIWNGDIQLQQQFRKALQIRRRVESDNSILCLNIKYLLQ